MTVLVHDLPGRLRFRVTGLKGRPAVAASVVGRMLTLPGVTAARANAVAGSLVVEHDAGPTRRGEIMAALSARAAALAPESRTSLAATLLVEAVMQRLVERALQAAIIARI